MLVPSPLPGYLSLIVRSVTTGPFQENTYVVGLDKSNECIVIDPGDEPEILKKEIDSFGVPLAMVCTHAHLDHLGAVHDLKKSYDFLTDPRLNMQLNVEAQKMYQAIKKDKFGNIED